MSAIEIVAVPAEAFSRVWPVAGGLLIQGMHAARLPVLQTMDAIRAGECTLWLVREDDPPVLHAVLLTELVLHDGMTVIEVKGLAGVKPQRWGKALCERMIEFGRKEKVDAVRFCGSTGWLRFHPAMRRVRAIAPGIALMEAPCYVI